MIELNSHISLFAGMGGFIKATESLGIKTIFSNDNDFNCINTLKHNFPKCSPFDGDITELNKPSQTNIDNLRNSSVDILTAGFPCQSFSLAGSNKGFQDPRGKLFFEIARFCKTLKDFPKIIILENVPNLLKHNGGERVAVIVQNLRTLGYWVNMDNVVILNSRLITGGPQNRERLFIFALHSNYFNSNPINEKLFQNTEEKIKLWDIIDNKNTNDNNSLYLPEDGKYYDQINRAIKKYGSDRLYQIRRVEVRAIAKGICPTLTAKMGAGGHNVPFVKDKKGIRKLTVNEVLELQGFDSKSFSFPDDIPKNSCYSMVGNSVNPKLVEKMLNVIINKISLKKVA